MTYEMRGVIASAGFVSGDRFVVGRWEDSPIGPMVDVMWARPSGERVLLASSVAGAFVQAIYVFEQVDVVPIEARLDSVHLTVAAGPLALSFEVGAGWRLPFGPRRPPWFTRWVEAPVARVVMGVRPYGVSPTGVREWYRADEYRPLVRGRASVDGVDCGAMRNLGPATRFGFSEPPRRPSFVRVRTLLDDPSGQLDSVLVV